MQDRKTLTVPDNLLCMISGELMHDPVMIESGQTYEKDVILRYIEIQKERADQTKEDWGDEFTDDDYKNFFKCPVTMVKI